MGVTPNRGDVFLVSLDTTEAREIKKTRPCLIISPDELNAHLSTFIVSPMTTGGHPYPFRVACRFQGQHGFVVLNQLRTVDRVRLKRRLGRISENALKTTLRILQEMFTE